MNEPLRSLFQSPNRSCNACCIGALCFMTSYLFTNFKEIPNYSDVPLTATLEIENTMDEVISESLKDTSERKSSKNITHNVKMYDEKALKIVLMAQDESHPIGERAITCVQAILDTYYPAKADMVEKIVYQPSLFGMKVRRVGLDITAKGTLFVGNYSISQVPTMFAAEVLRVGHELQHIDQYRHGMTPAQDNEKEFLAFTWEAQAKEFPGTGTISHTKRIKLCDEALQHYSKLSKDKQMDYKRKKENLEGIKRVHDYLLNNQR